MECVKLCVLLMNWVKLSFLLWVSLSTRCPRSQYLWLSDIFSPWRINRKLSENKDQGSTDVALAEMHESCIQNKWNVWRFVCVIVFSMQKKVAEIIKPPCFSLFHLTKNFQPTAAKTEIKIGLEFSLDLP